MFRNAIFTLALLAPSLAFGQAIVQQSPTKLDAATFMASTPAPATACATVNTTTANGTVTITPPAGQFVYITGVYIDVGSNATGTTSLATMAWANVTNPNGSAPVYALVSNAAAANVPVFQRQIAETYNPPLKSTAAGTVVTLTPSAQLSNSVVCPRVTGYFAP